MADRYRGTRCPRSPAWQRRRIGFPSAIRLHRLVWAEQATGIDDAIVHEKRLKRWRREWKFGLIERGNPHWRDFYDDLA